MSDDVFVHLIDFPDVKPAETVTKNEDCTYSVFLNSRLSDLMLREAYEHAIKHIYNSDFEKENVQDIEVEAHAKG
ncbi:MAG: hypothetical protein ACTTK0_05120 [Stomatobaculum sp.]